VSGTRASRKVRQRKFKVAAEEMRGDLGEVGVEDSLSTCYPTIPTLETTSLPWRRSRR
jgi:hypothetical protein